MKLRLNHYKLPENTEAVFALGEWGSHGEAGGRPMGGRTSNEKAHAPRDRMQRKGERHSLAWTRTLHFLQETRMLVPSSSR